eukprot:3766019-Alexandrium_andersonii.AAC.1
MAEMPGREANPLSKRSAAAFVRPPPHGRFALGESALLGQLGVPLRIAPNYYVKVGLPIARRPFAGSPPQSTYYQFSGHNRLNVQALAPTSSFSACSRQWGGS